MKKVLALVLAVIMVCTMAMAATTGTKTTTTVDAKGYTQYATNGEGVFVKELLPSKPSLKLPMAMMLQMTAPPLTMLTCTRLKRKAAPIISLPAPRLMLLISW